MTTNEPKTIKAASILTARSACDQDCVFRISVIKRTKKTATIIMQGEERRVKIKTDEDGNEYLKPDNYSMAPIYRAS